MHIWELGCIHEVQAMGKHIKMCLSGLYLFLPPHLVTEFCPSPSCTVLQYLRNSWSWETLSHFFCCLQILEASQNSSGRVLSYGWLLASGLNSRVNDRKLRLLGFSANSAGFPISFPQVTVYKTGKPTRFWHVLHTWGLMERRGCVMLAGVALRANLCKNKALLISVHVTNVSVHLMSVLYISDLYFMAFITMVS